MQFIAIIVCLSTVLHSARAGSYKSRLFGGNTPTVDHGAEFTEQEEHFSSALFKMDAPALTLEGTEVMLKNFMNFYLDHGIEPDKEHKYMGPVMGLLELSELDGEKCKSRYLDTAESVLLEGRTMVSQNILTFIRHYNGLQLNLCKQLFAEHLAEKLGELDEQDHRNARSLYEKVDSHQPTHIPMVDHEDSLDANALLKGTAVFMHDSISQLSSDFIFTKVQDLFGRLLDETKSLCQRVTEKLDPLLDTYRKFESADIEQLDKDQLVWMSSARVCREFSQLSWSSTDELRNLFTGTMDIGGTKHDAETSST